MPKQKNEIRYYFFALSNFVAAFGGGMILGKGMGVIELEFLQGGSVLAFLIGSVLGILSLQFIPKKWSNSLARGFSICGGVTSLILVLVFQQYAVNGKLTNVAGLLFFALLSIRFGFWFYSRVLRASASAGQGQRIAWVELGYYLGVIFGLIVWAFLGINMGMTMALIFDACLQFLAGFFDIYAARIQKKSISAEAPPTTPTIKQDRYQKIWLWRLASAMVFLTVGIQVIVFHLSHQVPELFGTFILSFFYLGAVIAAILCRKFNIQLEWYSARHNFGHAILSFGVNEKKKISFLLINVISTFFVVMAVFAIRYWNLIDLINIESISILVFVGLASFFYTILDLVILDRIGAEEQLSQGQGMIVRTYGLMAVGAAIFLWVLGLTKSSLFGLLFTLSACFVATILVARKRQFVSQN